MSGRGGRAPGPGGGGSAGNRPDRQSAGRDSAGWRRPPSAAERAELAQDRSVPAGLCVGCRHLRLLDSDRSRFVRCWLGESDPAYPRYPALPVLACNGHEAWDGED